MKPLGLGYGIIRQGASNHWYGVRWDSSGADSACVRTGNSALYLSQPIQSAMKRCLLHDNGTVNYYVDADNPHFKDGESTPVASGTTTGTSAGELVDSGADFINDGVVEGMVVKNTTDDTFAVIKGVAANTLTIAPDYFVSGEDYEVGTANYGGVDGQVMVEVPKFYDRQYHIGVYRYWDISEYRLSGFTLHPAFMKDGVEVDYRYHSAFEGSMYDDSVGAMCAKASVTNSIYATGDKFCSVAGQWAKTNEKWTEYREGSAARGTGWRDIDFTLNSAVQILYLVEYADFDSQDQIGMGRTELSGGGWTADSYIGMTGLSIGDGNGTNSVSVGGSSGYLTDYMTYRGIENWYGNVWKILEGITWDGRWTGTEAAQPVYYTNNADDFICEGSTNYVHLCDASYIGENAGYITDLENTFGFIPQSTGSSSLISDYYWQYSEIDRDYWRLVLFGCHALFSGAAGGFTLYVSDVWTLDLANVSARLAC